MAWPTILHYTGSDDDHGGIVSVVRALSATGRFECVLGVNPGCTQHRSPTLRVIELPRMNGEKIGMFNFWRARAVARAVRKWLQDDPQRVFHGHSRAGLLVALWLHRMKQARVVATVHCYGRQRWFFRWAAGELGDRLFWLTPAMRRYYGLPDTGWQNCLPGGAADSCSNITPAQSAPGKLRLGGAGQLVRWKRWELVLEAMAMLPADVRSRVTFEHIGHVADDADSQAYRHELAELVTARNLGQQVVWRGPEPSSDRLLGAIDALVVPSHQEPYSMILQEALAAGVPVFAAASGGPVDVVKPGVNGELFPDGDTRVLAAALRDWLARPLAWDRQHIRNSARLASAAAAQWSEIYAGL